MKFKEFKEICLKHKQIQKEKGAREADKFLKSCGLSSSYDISKKFMVPYCDFETTLIKFFDKENKQAEIEIYENSTGGEAATIYVENIEKYELNLYPFSIERTITLEEMYCYDDGTMNNITNKSGVGSLLLDFPNFEDDLWKLIKENNNKNKKEKIKEITTEKKNYNEQLELLTNPTKRNEQISLLTKAIERMNNEIKTIKDTLDEI